MKANTTELIKFKKLQRKLGESVRGTVGLLEMLWIATARNCPRGNIGRFNNEDIAILSDWAGCPDLLVNSLVECGWLDLCLEERLVVHDWQDHAPNYVKGNIKQGVEGFCVAVVAENKDDTMGILRSTPRDTPKDHPKDNPRDMPSEGPCPTPTKSSQVKSEYQAQPSEARPSAFCGVGLSPTPHEASGFEFLLADGSLWELPKSKLIEYSNSFPHLELEDELRKAIQWLRDNPRNRKTKSGITKYIGNWLARAQNKPVATKAIAQNGYHLTEAQKRLENSQRAGEDWVAKMQSSPLLNLASDTK